MEYMQKKLMNALLATKIHGWSNVTKSGKASAVSWYKADGESVCRMGNYQPTDDLNQAVEAVELMGAYHIDFIPGLNHQAIVEPYQKIGADQLGTGEGSTASMALVQAILAAAGIMVDQYESVDDLLSKDVVSEDGKIHYTCLRCSRPLRSKRSQIVGYGPECLKKEQEQPNLIDMLQKEHENTENFYDELTRKEAI